MGFNLREQAPSSTNYLLFIFLGKTPYASLVLPF
jgi:hypothetical protein